MIPVHAVKSFYYDNSDSLTVGKISFNNKLSPEILYAIEQEVINYELAELNINNDKGGL